MSRFAAIIMVAGLFSVFWMAVCPAETTRRTAKKEQPTVAELLDKYASTQDKLKSLGYVE